MSTLKGYRKKILKEDILLLFFHYSLYEAAASAENIQMTLLHMFL
jgi:hypothetical protein